MIRQLKTCLTWIKGVVSKQEWLAASSEVILVMVVSMQQCFT